MIIEELNNFIARAEKSRKYAPNVASNYRSPLKWIESELTDEEKNSLDVLKKNLDQIFNLLYSKHINTLSAITIEIYKKRMVSLISDYEKYGKDPSAMAAWSRPIITKIRKEPKAKSKTARESLGSEQANFLPPSFIAENSVEVGEFKLILPPTWDLDKARRAIAKGVFKEVYEELEKLSPKLEKQKEEKT